MEYFKLLMGLTLLSVFAWVFVRGYKRSGNIIKTIFHLDMLIGIAAGLFLVISSLGSILS